MRGIIGFLSALLAVFCLNTALVADSDKDISDGELLGNSKGAHSEMFDQSSHEECMKGCMTVKEWQAKVKTVQPVKCELKFGQRSYNAYKTDRLYCIIVNDSLYDDIDSMLTQYVDDVAGEDFIDTIEVYTWSGGTPDSLRAFLQDKYENDGLVGTLFIGDLPIATFFQDNIMEPYFLTDELYFEMDAVWADTNNDGIYDSLFCDSLEGYKQDIWFGRLTASPLVYTGETEDALVNKYFSKNHDYRLGELNIEHRSLFYGYCDLSTEGIAEYRTILRPAYKKQTWICDSSVVCGNHYQSILSQGYEFVEVHSHGSYTGHSFYGEGTQFIIADLVDSTDMKAHLIYSGSCSSGRYTEEDYLAGWYIFAHDYGLNCIAKTNTTAGGTSRAFHESIGNGTSIGVTILNIARSGTVLQKPEKPSIHILFGDPTLRYVFCDVADGDTDSDQVADDCDNCPDSANTNQTDTDNDYWGNACDTCTDTDDDGYGNPGYANNTCPDDNCPDVANADQTDADGDGIGDACDTCTDTDGDGYGNPGYAANTCALDNCPDVYNDGQEDSDSDSVGNVCDNCPTVSNSNQYNHDGDSLATACDNCPYTYNQNQTDTDSDDVGDSCDCYLATDSTWYKIYNFSSNDALFSLEESYSGDLFAAGQIGDSNTAMFAIDFNSCGQIIWYDTLSGFNAYNKANFCHQTRDSSKIIVGSHIGPNYVQQFATIKTDSNNDISWEAIISAQWGREGFSACSDLNNGSVTVGHWKETELNGQGLVVTRVADSTGSKSAYSFGSQGDILYDIILTADSHYIAVGSKLVNGQYTAWILKLDTEIELVWEATPGIDTAYNVAIYGVTESPFGGYVITGTRTDASDNNDIITMFIDADSTLSNTVTFGSSGADDVCKAIQTTSDSCFVIAGFTNYETPSSTDDYNSWVIKLDSLGESLTQWKDSLSGNEKIYDIAVITNELFVVAGESDSNFYLNKFIFPEDSSSCCDVAGDANNDGSVSLGDVIYINNYVYYGGSAPPCMQEGDANADGSVNTGDSTFLINYIMRGGPAPTCGP
ncbi:MAG: hypothetical protein KAR42_16345 [candidate division Zixibacteria bacterium]|nr:hypothetical protein [candidate division Zixibacteria bacterium]